MRRGRLHLLGGYPADGKTAMMLDFLRVICAALKSVDVHSIEMTAEELVERLVAAHGVAYNHAQSGRVVGPERDLALRAIDDMSKWDYVIHDEADATPASIEDKTATRDPDVVMIDHIHAFGHKDRFDVERVARELKAVAKRQGIPMLVLAHLSRARKFKQSDSAFPRPDMARLRESGMLEAWADTIWFAWRHRDEMDLPTYQGELIVAKSRFTQTGYTDLLFDGRFQRWEGGHT
jgi:replicative DNA helicase